MSSLAAPVRQTPAVVSSRQAWYSAASASETSSQLASTRMNAPASASALRNSAQAGVHDRRNAEGRVPPGREFRLIRLQGFPLVGRGRVFRVLGVQPVVDDAEPLLRRLDRRDGDGGPGQRPAGQGEAGQGDAAPQPAAAAPRRPQEHEAGDDAQRRLGQHQRQQVRQGPGDRLVHGACSPDAATGAHSVGRSLPERPATRGASRPLSSARSSRRRRVHGPAA